MAITMEEHIAPIIQIGGRNRGMKKVNIATSRDEEIMEDH